MNNEDFAHLHVHDEYSLLDGFGKASAYAKFAKEAGFKAMALTNHGNCDGLIKFQQACEKEGINPIFGVEMYFVEDISKKVKGETRYHLTLLAKNMDGFSNLLKMLTIANTEGYFVRPRIDWPTLKEHIDGLVAMTGCASSILLMPNAKQVLLGMKRLIPGDVYLEVMPHVYAPQSKVNKACHDAAEKYGLPLVASNDCHYISNDDTEAQEVLLAIQSKKKWKDPQRWKFDITGLYMKSASEMIETFRKQNDFRFPVYRKAILNTMEIVEKCSDFKIKQLSVNLPIVKRFKGRDDIEVLKELCEKGYQKLIKDKGLDSKKYRRQYEEEFEIITKQGFARYFIIVWELIDWCKKNDIMVGPGRGCFTGDTKVSLLDGTERSLAWLTKKYKDKDFWVYSCLPDGRIVPGKARNPRVTGIVERLCIIKLDDGSKIKCTEDHRFLLRNGKYRKAKDLVSGDSLMPLYRKYGRKGHEIIFDNRLKRQVETHYLTFKKKKGKAVHHVNFNRRDNRPENLNQITFSLHRSFHNLESWKDEQYREKAIERYWKNLGTEEIRNRKADQNRDPEFRKKVSVGQKRAWSNPEYKQKMLEGQMAYLNSPEMIEKRKKMLVKRNKSAKMRRIIAERNKDPEFQKKAQEGRRKNLLRDTTKQQVNHKVASIKFVDRKVNVYDIEVEKYHNFALTAGVFVHNSVGGSLVAYMLGITAVDPLKYGLNFYRFISPARIDLPDIDMDFEDIKRPLVRKHLEDEYGHYHVAGCATFMTMKGKGAIRDVSRVFDVPNIEVDKASKAIVQRSGGDFRADFTIDDAFSTFEDGIEFRKKYPKVTNIAMKLEGQTRGVGQHAAAIVISTDDLRDGDRACLRPGKEGELVVNWEKEDLEHVGLMKLDVLGLNALTVLNETRKLIKENHGKDIVFEDIPLDDKKVYAEFTKGNCVGCFQFGSLGLRRLCQELGIDNFMMLTHCNALHRPGTLRSGMTNEFIRRKTGESEWEHIHPFLEKLTGHTYGIILYQEQVMQFMYELGGLPWKTADTVRKVISKSQGVDQFMKFKEQFADGCVKKKTLDRESAEKVWDQLASFGCLTGDTEVYRVSSNQYSDSKMRVDELFSYQTSDNFKRRGLKILSQSADGMVRYNTVKQVYDTGKKVVFYIRTVSNKTIRASADHRFLVDGEWKTVARIKEGDLITVSNLELPRKAFGGEGYGSGPFGEESPVKRKGQGKTNERKRQKAKLVKKYKGRCQLCGSNKFIEMHHEDGDSSNNSDDNTFLFCRKCHRANTDKKLFRRFRTGYYTHQEVISEIKVIGERQTYDIEMVGEPRNFIANGFVSHNSYGFNLSHAVEYTLLAAWDMWLKIYYPTEFLSCSLSYGSEAKKEDLIEESIRLGIEVRPPKVGISRADRWIVKKGIMYAPFIEIKGIGDKVSAVLASLSKTKEGFFQKEGEKKISEKISATLLDIKADKDIPITDDEADRIQPHFTFSFSRDPMRKYRKVYARIKESLNIDVIKGTDWGTVEKEYRDYFGQMTQIRFGYRAAVKKLTTKERMKAAGGADYLGGVYGNFKDATDFCMLVFATDIYNKKKFEIEHCEGQFLLARANRPSRTSSLHCGDCWFDEEILAGSLDGMGLSLAESARFRNKDLLDCKDCELRKECRSPVLPSLGLYNIMIVGEAPGRDEDREGVGFCGDSGDLLWKRIGKHGYSRRDFHITNIGKCWPSKTRTPTMEQIGKCSRWIDEEIRELKPPLILAMGNTGMKYFRGEESGIMAKNAVTEWSDKFNAWICWVIHPASVLYHRENMEMFEQGIDNFIHKVQIIGGLKSRTKK